MNISGVSVTTKPENVDQLTKTINNIEWAEVRHTDEFGRMVVLIEGYDTGEEVKRLKELQSIPNILSAEMVYHYFEDEAERLAKESGTDQEKILSYLHEDMVPE